MVYYEGARKPTPTHDFHPRGLVYQARVNNNKTVVEISDTTPSGDVYWTRIRLSPTGIPGVLSPSVEAKRPVHDTGIVGTHTTIIM